MASATVVPGGGATFKVQVRKFDGSLATITGGTVTATVIAVGATDESAEVRVVDDTTRLLVVSGAQTLARKGKRITLRSVITPAGSTDAVGADIPINVGA